MLKEEKKRLLRVKFFCGLQNNSSETEAETETESKSTTALAHPPEDWL